MDYSVPDIDIAARTQGGYNHTSHHCKIMLGLCLDLPLWRQTEGLELLFQILQLRVELVLLAIKVGHYVVDMSVAVSPSCVLLRLLLSSWLSDALLVAIGCRIE